MDSYIEVAAEVKPAPNRDRFHKVFIDQVETKFATWEGLYGNKESKLLLSIPHSNIIEVEYLPPKPIFFRDHCQITYSGDAGQTEKIKFKVIDFKSPKNDHTATITEILTNIHLGKNALPPTPWLLPLRRQTTARKFFFGLFLFADSIILLSIIKKTSFFVLFLGTMILSVSLAALSIDYFAFNTGWHPVFKIAATIAVFCVAFVLFATAMFLYEMFGLI